MPSPSRFSDTYAKSFILFNVILARSENRVNTRGYYKSILPNGYQRLEYIERPGSTSQIYIDTNVPSSLNLELEAIYCYTKADNAGENTICSSGTNSGDGIVMTHWASGPSHAFRFGNKGYYPTAGFKIIPNQYYHIILNKTEVKVDGVVRGTFNATSTINNDIYIGYDIWNGTSSAGSFKLKYFKITDGDTVIREFIPCKEISTGKAGLYDLINGEFYSNAVESSTVDFIAGPDITVKEINKTIYYREVEVE